MNTVHWTAWKPSSEQPWDLRRVVHLHRRAGFAANWQRLQDDLRDGPDTAISRMLTPDPGQPTQAHRDTVVSPGETAARTVTHPEFFRMADVIGEAAAGSGSANRLKAWWIYRMLYTPDPLGERLTLMWHNHFATSNLKVENLEAMRRQNQIFREFGRGPFGELLRQVVKDQALLVFLDADANRKEHPNENLARELMELFTLGVGHYSEADVRESARALTGWGVKDGKFRSVAQYHDSGEKTLLTKTGNWTGDDLLQILIGQPATARRLAFRLCELLLGEGVVQDAALDELAQALLEHNLDVGWALGLIVRSELFFSDKNIGKRVLSPVEFIVNTVRALEMLTPPPSTLLLAEWSTALGQDLFFPPNVFGWPGGRNWLTTRTLIGRSNFVTALIDGTLFKPAHQFEADQMALRHGFTVPQGSEFYGQLLTGLDASSPTTKQVLSRLPSSPDASPNEFLRALLTSAAGILG